MFVLLVLLRAAGGFVCPRLEVETFCADRVMERYSAAMKQKPPPDRLLELSLTVDDHLTIQKKAKPGLGLRQLVELEVRQRASPAPAQIGQLFSLVGESRLFPRMDVRRKVKKGTSPDELDRIVTRRNRIAYTGDRAGRGRAMIAVSEVEADLVLVSEIVTALDEETRR
ncbi:hypothetical protein [Kitasatospora acidiphila]|uniref:hypothetical protein n=1 Tax=Kitasatospora acidiphila TaxID=2567942 RepID=UPI003C71BDB5